MHFIFRTMASTSLTQWGIRASSDSMDNAFVGIEWNMAGVNAVWTVLVFAPLVLKKRGKCSKSPARPNDTLNCYCCNTNSDMVLIQWYWSYHGGKILERRIHFHMLAIGRRYMAIAVVIVRSIRVVRYVHVAHNEVHLYWQAVVMSRLKCSWI